MELTIEVLQENHSLTNDQLDHEIGEQETFYVAELFGSWSQYVGTPGLGLSRGEKAQIVEDPALISNTLRMKEALKIWRSANPFAATFRKLLSILLSLNTQGDVAQDVCKYLTNCGDSQLSGGVKAGGHRSVIAVGPSRSDPQGVHGNSSGGGTEIIPPFKSNVGAAGTIPDHELQKMGDLCILKKGKIGSGAFGVVFKGWYKSWQCAVKVLHQLATEIQTDLPATSGGQDEAKKAFEEECEFLESFKHPNVVQHLSTIKHPSSGQTVLVTELMDCSLRQYMARLGEEHLTSKMEASISKDVVSALAYIHSRHIIHRDLCGDNVLLKCDGPIPVAKISDFGMSRLLDTSTMSSTLTALGHRMGYLPPEAPLIDASKYDLSLDIFSFGVIMIQIVRKLETVRTPNDRNFNFAQITFTHPLKTLIGDCLNEDKDKRPTASHIYDNLVRLISGQIGSAAVPTELFIQQMIENAGITEAQLKERIAESHLYQIPNIIGDGWRDLVPQLGLSDEAENATEALKRWWTGVGDTSYRSLVVALLRVNRLTHAEKVITLVKDGVALGQSETVETGQGKRYCTGESFQEEEEEELQPTLDDAGWGSVRQSKLWDVASYRTLKVHFLNPEVLRDKKKTWTYGRHQNQLTTDLILSWACTWNTPDQDYPKLPDHDETNPADAQIRVKFDTTRISESKVGKDALRVTDKTKPTMILNLFDMSDAAQKSYVIHEFGHVLGLDHEHQRSQFWDVLAEKDQKGDYRFIVGFENMKKKRSYGEPVCEQHLRKGWTEQEMTTTKPAYDPDSIMHYWFDKRWLLPKYQDLGTVRTAIDLSEEQKKVLEGVHARDVRKYNNLLPVGQSSLDYQALKDAYRR